MYHYVTEHGYRPPAGFVKAVMSGELEVPDPRPAGGVRTAGTLGMLHLMDPALHAELLQELSAEGADTRLIDDVEVHDGVRFEAPGVPRPVLVWLLRKVGYPGHHIVAFDGSDSWRDQVRQVASTRLFALGPPEGRAQ